MASTSIHVLYIDIKPPDTSILRTSFVNHVARTFRHVRFTTLPTNLVNLSSSLIESNGSCNQGVPLSTLENEKFPRVSMMNESPLCAGDPVPHWIIFQ